jgi:hypothetical protein
MAFRDTIDNLAEKCGLTPGDTMQYCLVGVLFLVIVIAVISFGTDAFDGDPGKRSPEPDIYPMWCAETDQEYEMSREDVNKFREKCREEHQDTHPAAIRFPSPHSGENTGIKKVRCPKCLKFYLPKEWKEAGMDGDPRDLYDAPPKCPDCGISEHEYRRAERDRIRANE